MLFEVWERIRVDSTINAVVLRASPGRAFCPACTCAMAATS